ncbi:MucBP domain-containing protein [Furfurilactobacillus curtus]|uniref:MucBP domain-containing protein n=1 Tax=Furfurilactobacillus curtus TaxID=1746200 RepID=A0ABQ5JQN8_9LACO
MKKTILAATLPLVAGSCLTGMPALIVSADKTDKQPHAQIFKPKTSSVLNELILSKQQATSQEISNQASKSIVEVTPENFLDHFGLQSNATYNNGVVTLTPDKTQQKGSMFLKDKVDFTKDFTFEGAVDLGSKVGPSGADGIAFFFHAGEPSAIGNYGALLGMNLPNTFGLKLDTFFNDYSAPDPNSNDESHFFGWPADLRIDKANQYGAWVQTDASGNPSYDFNQAQAIPDTEMNGQFQNFKMTYTAAGNQLTITYGAHTWTKTVSEPDVAKAFTIAASTGAMSNLQQVKFTKMSYTPDNEAPAKINVKYVYVDPSSGNEREVSPMTEAIGEDGEEYISKPAVVSGYKLDESRLPDNATEIFDSENVKTITYYYLRDPDSLRNVVRMQFLKQGTDIQLTSEEEMSDFVGETWTSPYIDTPKAIPGWHLVERPTTETGIYASPEITGPTVLKYYYEQNDPIEYGKITVEYRNRQTNEEVATPETLEVPLSTQYNITDLRKSVPGYQLVDYPIEQGTLSTPTLTLIYYYDEIPQASAVTVHYVDKDRQDVDLIASKRLTGIAGDEYSADVEDIDGYEIYDQSQATGFFEKEERDVYILYTKTPDPVEKGTVHVVHQYEDGTKIDEATLTGDIGEPYNTKPLEDYQLAENGQPENANGTFTSDPQTVTYVYTKTPDPVEKGTVHVVHQYEDGTKIDEATLTGDIGEPYNTKPLENYQLAENGQPENANGTFTSDPQTVTYVYTKTPDPVEKGTVHVVHQYEDGETISTEDLTGDVATAYTTKQLTGYKLADDGYPDNANGTFTSESQTVTYTYVRETPPVEIGSIHVIHRYQNGEVIAEYTSSDVVGASYKTEPLAGYDLISTPDNANGTYASETQTIVYEYKDVDPEPPVTNGTVNVVHQYEDGTKITEYSMAGAVGQDYLTEPLPDYTLTANGQPANATGKFIDGTIQVTYIYEKPEDPQPPVQLGQVTVNHQYEDGTLIHSYELAGPVGEAYQTEPIAGLSLVTQPTNAKGQYTNQPQTVTYVYRNGDPDPQPPVQLGQVHVIHQYEDGSLIHDYRTSGIVGDAYTTSPLPGYQLVKKPANANGEFTANEQTVIYVYAQADPEPGNPEEPEDPTNPIDPEGPTDPSRPTDPTSPEHPTAPADPSGTGTATANTVQSPSTGLTEDLLATTNRKSTPAANKNASSLSKPAAEKTPDTGRQQSRKTSILVGIGLFLTSLFTLSFYRRRH